MKETYRIIPVYTGDVSGVASALYELGGMVVIHDPSGCNSTYNTHDETRWYEKESLIFISGLSERDAILGNDNKLIADVVSAAKELHPAFIALTNSPIPFMNGTDFEAIARVIEKQTNIPAFFAPANGMHDYTYGAGNAFAKLADFMKPKISGSDVRPDKKSGKPITARSVNILGVTPLDFDAPGSVEIMEELLEANGFFVNCCLGMGDTAGNWREAAFASVNLVVSSVGLPIAKKMEERFGIPYVVGTPVGTFVKPLLEEIEKADKSRKSVAAALSLGKSIDFEPEGESPIILIGEAVTMKSLAMAIRLQCNVKIQPRVICPLEAGRELLGEKDRHVEGEEELEGLLKKMAENQDITVVADPLYRPVLPRNAKFIPLSHEAFSGRCFRKERKCLVGMQADALSEILESMRCSRKKGQEDVIE